MGWEEQVRRDHELPEKPEKKKCKQYFIYKEGNFYGSCPYEKLPFLPGIPLPEPDEGEDHPHPSEVLVFLQEEKFVVEEVLNERTYQEALADHRQAVQDKLAEIRKEICSEKYLGIYDDATTELLFELTCRKNREWKYGYDYMEFLEKVAVQFLSYCEVMKDRLRPLPGCYTHNPRMEGTKYIFSHWTELDPRNLESFKERIKEFLKEDKHTLEDQIRIALEFHQAAREHEKLDILPSELLDLVVMANELPTTEQSDSTAP